MFGRKIRSNLPVVGQVLCKSNLNHEKYEKQKSVQKKKQKPLFDKRACKSELSEGESVRLRYIGDTCWSEKWFVKFQLDPRSYIIEMSDGSWYTRNRKYILKTPEQYDKVDLNDDLVVNDNEEHVNLGTRVCVWQTLEQPSEAPEMQAPRRFERVQSIPKRLIEDV